MVAIPRPVELLSGETKSPSDWRAPMVTMSSAAAESVTTRAWFLFMAARSVVERDEGRAAARALQDSHAPLQLGVRARLLEITLGCVLVPPPATQPLEEAFVSSPAAGRCTGVHGRPAFQLIDEPPHRQYDKGSGNEQKQGERIKLRGFPNV